MLNAGWYENLGLGEIYGKVQGAERLSLEDGEKLLACPDVVAVGALAHHVRTRLHGQAAYYVLNQHINYSNICINGCLFCAFGRVKGESQAFQLSTEDLLNKLKEREKEPITEIHIVGGCHPDLPFSYYESILREVKAFRPSAVIKAFTAVEIAHFAKQTGKSTREILLRLKSVGLDMLPGGGAEVFSPRVRSLLCPHKLSGDQWLAVSREAHELGIRSNATMLYGHVETPRERLEHLDALRRLQDETGGFVCFIPLPFQPANTRVGKVEPTTGVEDLKNMAVCRLMLDNIPHIKAYWVMLTVKLAQVALHFGADDLDGTVVEEKIGHMAGAESEQALTRPELERLIRDAGFQPVERNSFFEKVAD
ncbi:MAG: aminofutalosine synthase MqnE [Deltaproteobacteria bacterium]|nr:aminofutalosine synthase MqnE [Deltaproteobacteria bacterium]